MEYLEIVIFIGVYIPLPRIAGLCPRFNLIFQVIFEVLPVEKLRFGFSFTCFREIEDWDVADEDGIGLLCLIFGVDEPVPLIF